MNSYRLSRDQADRITNRKLLSGALALGWLSLMSSPAAHWPQWRGPNGDGISPETNVPIKWSATENVAWKSPIPGEGHSSPVVWGESVFLTTALPETQDRQLLRLDARTGKILWQRSVVKAAREAMHRENSPASSTPVTDGERVFTSFQDGPRVDLRCFDFAGKQLWALQPLTFEGEHGYSYTPVVYRDLLIFDFRQEGEAALLALDKRTGQERWRVEPSRRRISHITPFLIDDGRRPQLIVSGSDETRSVNPETGETIWWCRGPSDVSVAGLSYGSGVLFVTAGYPDRNRMGLRVDGSGDVSSTHVAWRSRRQVTYVPSPVYHDGHFYSILDEGILCCFDAQTGETVWDHRLEGRVRSSLVLAGGNIYSTNDKGVTTIFRATPKGFEPVAVNDLKEFCYSTPAIANGRLYLRTGKNLYCIGSRDTGASKETSEASTTASR